MKKLRLYGLMAAMIAAIIVGSVCVGAAMMPQSAPDQYVLPSVTTVKDGTYPIARSLFLYTDGEPIGEIKNFIDFIMSPIGQAIVEDEAFVAVDEKGLLPGDETEEELVIEGSTTVNPIMTAVVEDLDSIFENKTITVSGTGSSAGIAALIAGTVDIAMASRAMKDSEKVSLPNWYETTVSRDGIGVIVHPTNIVTNLTMDQIRRIYNGTITNWNQVGGADASIVVINRDATSGTREFFWEHVLQKDNFVATAIEVASNGAVRTQVASTPNAIGYVGLGYLDATTKAIGVKANAETAAVLPSVETVLDGTFPIARSLYLYTNSAPTGFTKVVIDYILNPMGQAVVIEEGFVPVGPVGYRPGEGPANVEEIIIEGSTTVNPIITATVEAYNNLFENVTITVSGTGSSAGIAALIAGTVDIAMASRAMKSSELVLLPTAEEFTIARDGIGVIVHSTNTVSQLTVSDLRKIFNGTITNWNQVGGADAEIVVINRDATSGTREFFWEHVLQKDNFIATAIEVASNGAVRTQVASTPNAIGYVGLGYLDETTKTVAVKSTGESTSTTSTTTLTTTPTTTTPVGFIPGYSIVVLLGAVAITVGLILYKRKR